jgi:hypothetical protein
MLYLIHLDVGSRSRMYLSEILVILRDHLILVGNFIYQEVLRYC